MTATRLDLTESEIVYDGEHDRLTLWTTPQNNVCLTVYNDPDAACARLGHAEIYISLTDLRALRDELTGRIDAIEAGR